MWLSGWCSWYHIGCVATRVRTDFPGGGLNQGVWASHFFRRKLKIEVQVNLICDTHLYYLFHISVDVTHRLLRVTTRSVTTCASATFFSQQIFRHHYDSLAFTMVCWRPPSSTCSSFGCAVLVCLNCCCTSDWEGEVVRYCQRVRVYRGKCWLRLRLRLRLRLVGGSWREHTCHKTPS